jgi:hypothetical protein
MTRAVAKVPPGPFRKMQKMLKGRRILVGLGEVGLW